MTDAADRTGPASSRAGAWCALLGVLGSVVVLVQAWGYGRWRTASGLEPVRAAAPLPSDVAADVRSAELTLVVLAAAWLAFVAWDWWRQRTLTWPLLWTIAWASTFWQEPLVNVRHHTFSFNTGFRNAGDWTTHLPLVPDSYSPLPEAIVMEGLVFLALLPCLAFGVAALLRLAHRRLGIRNRALLIAVGYLAVVAFDAAFELAGIGQQLLAYVELGGPALDAGDHNQWPLYEGAAIGAAWAFPGILMFLRRDFPPEGARETQPRWWQGRRAAALTIVTAIGAVNLVFGLYNAGYVAIMDGTVTDQPEWLAPTHSTQAP